MILEKQTEITVLEDAEEQCQSYDMTVDLESTQYIMQMLSKDLYSDPIGSLIRETASNALDSHRKAGVDDPIIVSLYREPASGFVFSVEDFGIGLDDEDVEGIIRKYGKSTKRDSAKELGLFGLGFKSPLSYTSSFYFIARKDGIERKYMMYQSDDVNKIDLLYESPTKERNGVKVIVPVNYNDNYTFGVRMREQLAYFEGVYFSCSGLSNPINNSFSIIRTEHYQVSELCSDNYMHICLDNVYYPIDFEKLGISRIGINVGLRFGLEDGIYPTPNRETIRYTKEAKATILKKIAIVSEEIIKEYNKGIEMAPTVFDVINSYNQRYVHWQFGTRRFDISPLEKYSSVKLVKPEIEGIKHIDLSSWRMRDASVITCEYEDVAVLRTGASKWTAPKYYSLTLDSFRYGNTNRKIFLLDGEEGEIQKRNYLRATSDSAVEYHLIKKREPLKLKKGDNSYYDILSLKGKPKKEWRALIKEFQLYQSLIMRDVVKMSDLVIPQDWIDEKKKTRKLAAKTAAQTRKSNSTKRLKPEGTILCKLARDPQKYIGRNCVFDNSSINLATLHRYKGLTFYTSHENGDKMDGVYKIMRSRARFVTFSEKDLKYISTLEIHNLKPIEYLMTKDCKPFRRIATSYLIYKLADEFRYSFNRISSLDGISTSLCEKIKELIEYKDTHYVNIYGGKDTYEAMIEAAEEHNLYDYSIYSTYVEVRDMLRAHPFIETLLQQLPIDKSRPCGDDDIKRKIICDVFRQNKIKMDVCNYQHAPKEEEKEDLVLTV